MIFQPRWRRDSTVPWFPDSAVPRSPQRGPGAIPPPPRSPQDGGRERRAPGPAPRGEEGGGRAAAMLLCPWGGDGGPDTAATPAPAGRRAPARAGAPRHALPSGKDPPGLLLVPRRGGPARRAGAWRSAAALSLRAAHAPSAAGEGRRRGRHGALGPAALGTAGRRRRRSRPGSAAAVRRPPVPGLAAMPGGPGPGPALRGSGGRGRVGSPGQGGSYCPWPVSLARRCRPPARPARVAGSRWARPGIVPCRWHPPAAARLLRPLAPCCQQCSAALVRAAEIAVPFVSGTC